MNGGIENKDARAVVAWIQRHGLESFNQSTLTSDLRWLNDRVGGPDGVLGWLGERHVIRKCPTLPREPGKRGKTPSPTYEVNPVLIATRNPKNTRYSPRGGSGSTPDEIISYSSYFSGAQSGGIEGDEQEVIWTV